MINFSKTIGKILIAIILWSCNNPEQRKIASTGQNDVDSPSNKKSLLFSEADFYFQNHNDSLAIEYLDSLIYLDSANGKYYFMRAKSHSRLFKKKSAINDYLKSAIFKYRISDSYFNAAVNNMYENDSLAIIYFNKSLEINPKEESAEFLISECRKRLNQKRPILNPATKLK